MLNPDKVVHISQAVRERLFYIDFKLRFLGNISRQDLVTRFDIKAAASTRDIALYKSLAPDNLSYDTKAKTYVAAEGFTAVFDYPGNQALSALCYGLGDDHVEAGIALIPSEAPTQLNFPDLDVLAAVTRAIHHQHALTIEYCSLSSGCDMREIVPFALVDNGLRWHVRAFDRKHKRFADFVINRIAKPQKRDGIITPDQTREADIQWNRIVEMHIVPHPQLKHPETIEKEYGMVSGKLKVLVRAAVAGYVLRRWNVDVSERHSLDQPEIHLWLQNRQTLYGVDNLAIAPGYTLNWK